MMRYYFDSLNDRFAVHDKDGVDLPNIEAARAQATRALGGILTDASSTETSGRVLVTVRIGEDPKAIIKALAFFDISEAA